MSSPGMAWQHAGEDELRDVLLVDDEGFLLVEVLAHHHELLRLVVLFVSLFVLAVAEEGDIVAPTA